MTNVETNSIKWWNVVKIDPIRTNAWLLKQYRGEALAAIRIKEFAASFPDKKAARIINTIARQEAKHASWIHDLLTTRGLQPDGSDGRSRYWKVVDKAANDPIHTAAIAAHAEGMRLARIRAICNDVTTPSDIRSTFMKILKDEEFHERAFRQIAGEQAMNDTIGLHEEGLKTLGLAA